MAVKRDPVPPAELVITVQVRRMCGNPARSTLLRWRRDKGFPEPVRAIRVGHGRKAQVVEIWDRRDVRAWLKANPPLTREIRP